MTDANTNGQSAAKSAAAGSRTKAQGDAKQNDAACDAKKRKPNAANAVPWTKPHDLTSDAGEISKMTKGIRGGDKFLVINCDGSVHMLPSDSTKLLKTILTRNGGEVIDIPNVH